MSNFDPVSQDEPSIDAAYPPATASFTIESAGQPMNGLLYIANGAGPHPTALLLHGYPGNEKSLDVAQAMRRAGWNVLFFHYRGAWGSGGTYAMMHAVDDVHAAIDFLLSAENGAAYRVDTTQLALVGHSMGGYLSLLVGGRRAEIGRICSMAGVHMRRLHEQAVANPAVAAELAAGLDDTHALRGHNFASNVATMSQDWAQYDLLADSADFTHKRVLLLAAERDELLPVSHHHAPIVADLLARDNVALTHATLDCDHAFSGKRIALTRHVVDWLTAA